MAIRLTGLASGLDTESIISELVSAYRLKEQKYEKAQKKLSWKQDAWKSLNIKIKSLYDTAKDLRFSSAYAQKKTTVSDATKATITASGTAVNGTQSLNIAKLAKATYITGDTLSATGTGGAATTATSTTTLSQLGYTGSGGNIEVKDHDGNVVKTISVTGDTKLETIVSELSGATGVKASFDETNQRLFVTASDTGLANEISLSGDSDILSALKLSADSGATVVAAQDSKITLNGATFTSANNKYSINGLTIECLAETGTTDLSITTDTDTQGLYDTVKSFFSQYNSLVNEMTSLYNADSAKGYEPLTSEEKDAMTDTEVEEWEAKIKSALLRRDDTLDSVLNGMTTSMSSSYYIYNGSAITLDSTTNAYKCNGVVLTDNDGNNITTSSALKTWATQHGAKNYSLSSFGIKTEGYLNASENEQNAFHIDGDSDDDVSKSNEDKLLTLLQTDPDTVTGFMKQITSDLYSAINTKMGSTTMSSIYVVYNDKEMAQEYSDYTDTISEWEEKLTNLEDYYYKKFTAMESALASLQSQSSSLSSLLS